MSNKEPEPAADPRCGTSAGYQAHRRAGQPACTACRAGAAADRRRRVAYEYLTGGQKMMIDASGTARRVRALVRIGWSLTELSERLGVSFQNVHTYTKRDRVYRSTAAKVAALYDELSMIPGPSSSAAKRAAAKGWPPPLAWDDETIDDPRSRPSGRYGDRRRGGRAFDEIAVERAMRGEAVRLRPAERAEAVRRLTKLRFSAAQIADRLRISDRSATRLRGAGDEAA